MAVPKNVIIKEKKSKEDENTSADLSSAHRRSLHYYVTAFRIRFWRISNASTVAFIKI